MTDKEKFRKEVEKLKSNLIHGACSSQVAMETRCKEEAYNEVLTLLTMQEEPVSEELEEASKEWLKPQLDKSYADYGETKMMELTHFDGYAMLDAIEFGAKWKEQQMMKKSISKSVCLSLTGTHVELDQDDIHQLGLLFGDKIKLIAIKED